MSNGIDPTTTVHNYEPAIETMRDDVLRGLTRSPKKLPSQYLYDKRGARLFEGICDTQEYYLTRTEIAILEQQLDAIVDHIGPRALVVEPGSGSGIKTQMLLDKLEDPAGYMPIDVSRQQLARFADEMNRRFPDLEVTPICADFTTTYELPPCRNTARKRVAFFPGSTIGNFAPTDAIDVLRHLAEICEKDGGVLMGVDLKKDRAILEPAYDDRQGVSRDFALNILVRLNRELYAGFDLRHFDYEAPYNEVAGRIEMALVSRCRQVVRVADVPVPFAADERVLTEYSYKYSPEDFAALAERAGLHVSKVWTDPDQLFSVQYLEPA